MKNIYQPDSPLFVNNISERRGNQWEIVRLFVITLKQEPMDTTGTTQESLQQQIDELKAKLTGDMFSDMDIKDQIHNLEMKLNGVKPMDSHFDCIGCGS